MCDPKTTFKLCIISLYRIHKLIYTNYLSTEGKVCSIVKPLLPVSIWSLNKAIARSMYVLESLHTEMTNIAQASFNAIPLTQVSFYLHHGRILLFLTAGKSICTTETNDQEPHF